MINCNIISSELEEEELDERVRSWINAHLEELDSSIKASRLVDNDRFFSCTPQLLNPYFNLVKPLLENTHPHLDPKLKKKYVVPQEVREFITKKSIWTNSTLQRDVGS